MAESTSSAGMCTNGSFIHFICIVPKLCILSLRHFQDFCVLRSYRLHLEFGDYTVTVEKYILGKNCLCTTTAILFFTFLCFITDLSK